jgi:hypothetical protein
LLNSEENMKDFIIFRNTIVTFLLMLAGTTLVVAQNADSGNVKTTIGPVVQFGNPSVVIPYAGASLSRNNAGVMATISTSGLTPGHVVTLWWAIFNNPRYCGSIPCAPLDLNNQLVHGSLQFGGGQIVGENGRADFSGYLGIGDASGFFKLFPNMPDPPVGVEYPKTAQIHLVIRDHGPALTGQNPGTPENPTLYDQLNSFGGGCAVQTCRNVQAAIF